MLAISQIVNKCLNVHERVDVVKINKNGRSLLSCKFPVSVKEKRDYYIQLIIFKFIPSLVGLAKNTK